MFDKIRSRGLDASRERKRRACPGLLFAVGCALLIWAPVARASTLDLGPGLKPTVAVDAAGTAYIAYNGVEPNSPTVHYCKLPRGASSCSQSLTLTPAGGSVSAPYAFVDAAGTVRLLTGRYGFASGPFDQDLLYTSTDGGKSFGPPATVGTIAPFDGEALAGPGGAISITNGASATHAFQAVPTDGTSAGEAVAALAQNYPYQGSVGLVNPSTPLVTFNDGHGSPDTTAFSVYMGPGSLDDSASWSPPAVVAAGAQGHLAGGSLGLFLMLRSPAGGNHLELRMFNGSAFGSPITVTASKDALFDSALAQDAGGRLHAVWAKAQQLMYWASTNPTARNPAPTVVASDPTFDAVRIALASDHRGVAVWGTDNGSGKHVHATVLAPPPSLSVAPLQIRNTITGTVLEVPIGGNLRIDLLSGRLTASAARTSVLGSTTLHNVRSSQVGFKVKLNRQGRRALARRRKLALTVRAIIIVGGKQQSVLTSQVTLKR